MLAALLRMMPGLVVAVEDGEVEPSAKLVFSWAALLLILLLSLKSFDGVNE